MTNKIKVYYEIEFPHGDNGKYKMDLLKSKIERLIDEVVRYDRAKVTGGNVVVNEEVEGED